MNVVEKGSIQSSIRRHAIGPCLVLSSRACRSSFLTEPISLVHTRVDIAVFDFSTRSDTNKARQFLFFLLESYFAEQRITFLQTSSSVSDHLS
jgi:hypothetical protein